MSKSYNKKSEYSGDKETRRNKQIKRIMKSRKGLNYMVYAMNRDMYYDFDIEDTD